MYTNCMIRFVDGVTTDVIIKATHDFVESEDVEIFYYGLSREDLVEACTNGWMYDNEWEVVEVYETWD